MKGSIFNELTLPTTSRPRGPFSLTAYRYFCPALMVSQEGFSLFTTCWCVLVIWPVSLSKA